MGKRLENDQGRPTAPRACLPCQGHNQPMIPVPGNQIQEVGTGSRGAGEDDKGGGTLLQLQGVCLRMQISDPELENFRHGPAHGKGAAAGPERAGVLNPTRQQGSGLYLKSQPCLCFTNLLPEGLAVTFGPRAVLCEGVWLPGKPEEMPDSCPCL